MNCGGNPTRLCWAEENYIDGDQLTRPAQEHYAEYHGQEVRKCCHCYDVEDGYPCCYCQGTGYTDNPDGWETEGRSLWNLLSESQTRGSKGPLPSREFLGDP